MSPLDWAVMAFTITAIISYGLYRSRASKTVSQYLLANKSMPWYAMALSIMATQASAITFVSTTGQAFVDGMRFVQFYFGMPVAMVILSATAVPIFHRAGVYTAYEYLEKRFDTKTRALASCIFLIQRGVSVGLALYAPAIVLTVILGLPDRMTTVIMGAVVIAYTVIGGVQAIAWTDVQQMLIIFAGLVFALVITVSLLPADVSFVDAIHLAGTAGRLNVIDLHFDWNNRYNLWSGLIGGAFLALSYFGCDQSQVQRYLTGKSIAQSKLGLLFNAMAKVPMQFFILFVGAMVFVFYLFVQPPLLFQKVALDGIRTLPEYRAIEGRFAQAFDGRRQAAKDLVEARRSGSQERGAGAEARFRQSQKEIDQLRKEGATLAERKSGAGGFNDTNYIFLSFVTRYLPAGLIGLIMAVIFAAAMSTISAEVNSLATVTVMDIYRRHVNQNGSDGHYLIVSRIATVFWGVYAILFSEYGKRLGSLVEAVNMLGSLFYGSMLGVFVLAFFVKHVRGTAAFTGMLIGEAVVLSCWWLTGISFLWYNVIGCVVVIIAALVITAVLPKPSVIEA